MCVRAPLWGRRRVSVRSRKSGVCKSISETMFVSEGSLEPTFYTLRIKKESLSEGNAPCVAVLFAHKALASRSATRGEGGGLG